VAQHAEKVRRSSDKKKNENLERVKDKGNEMWWQLYLARKVPIWFLMLFLTSIRNSTNLLDNFRYLPTKPDHSIKA
jgi:hypothetical protein